MALQPPRLTADAHAVASELPERFSSRCLRTASRPCPAPGVPGTACLLVWQSVSTSRCFGGARGVR
eukprot:12203505-Alexandrium_andersonii.AAC.1